MPGITVVLEGEEERSEITSELWGVGLQEHQSLGYWELGLVVQESLVYWEIPEIDLIERRTAMEQELPHKREVHLK